MALTLPEIEAEYHHLITQAQSEGIILRLVGGLAVWMHCPRARRLAGEREYNDLDFVTDKPGGQRLAAFFSTLGYLPNRQLNILNGDRRQAYFKENGALQVDIFVGTFEMSHRLSMGGRLTLEPITVPLAELFLTKAQITQLNQKDMVDMIWLLADHETGVGDDETLNLEQISRYCANDWGLYTTVSLNLAQLKDFLESNKIIPDDFSRERVLKRLASIQDAINAVEKSVAWKIRAKIGKRWRWYEEVEEVQR